MLIKFLLIMMTLSIHSMAFSQSNWETDFVAQNPNHQPALEARYQSAARDAFMIEAERYSIELDLNQTNQHAITAINVGGENKRKLYKNGYFEIEVVNGTVWNTLNVETPSRINLYRRGPYYNEIHWLDVAFTNSEGETAPIKGEVVFYSYAESCRIGIVLHATEEIEIKKLSWVLNKADGTENFDIPFSNIPRARAHSNDAEKNIVWFETTEPTARFDETEDNRMVMSWLSGEDESVKLLPQQPQEFNVGMAVIVSQNLNDLLSFVAPISKEKLSLQEGLSFEFDARRGDYVVSTHNPGDFTYHYNNPNEYPTAKIKFQNNEFPRKIYVRHQITTGVPGLVECGVVLNEDNEVLPIKVQISKNFAGEKEEEFYNPKDTPFSETFFPLMLDANETCELTSWQLYQNWGNHPLKQFSSLGAWMDYFHMSTGVTETTCYVPFKFYTGISIADLRGMSGTMWESQPQHDNVGGHIFMEYYPTDKSEKQVNEYLGTDYHSTGPNWAHVTMNHLSSDERIHMALETFEYPQEDELRNFIRLRFEILADVPIADWATDFRIMQIDTHTQSLRYQHITYTDDQGEPVTKDIQFDNTWTLKGQPLNGKAPTAVLWNSPKGNNAFIIEDVRGTIGGKPLKTLAISCEGRSSGDSNLVLVPHTDADGFIKGDTFEIDLFIMPFGKDDDDYSAAFQERERYGLNPVRFSNLRGAKLLSHFPPIIKKVDDDLGFEITGGYSTMAICIQGLDDDHAWQLQQETPNGWKPLEHASGQHDTIRGEGQQHYIASDGSFGMVFRVNLTGDRQRFRLVQP